MRKNTTRSDETSGAKRSHDAHRRSALQQQVRIRKMREDDIGHVVAIEEQARAASWNRTAFLEEICNPLSLVQVAEYRGEIVGYLCASMVLDEGHILNLSVHPCNRRRGIAKRLVRDILSRMAHHGCNQVFLEVRTGNRAAITMYEQFDFLPVGRRKEYYRNPVEDALVMRCTVRAEATGRSGPAA